MATDKNAKTTGGELFIVDNSDADWKVLQYLHDWCQLSSQIDIATGFFEIGSLLALKDEWQKVDKIRILMGNEVSLRTRNAFEQGLRSITQKLDGSIEKEKEKNDFLTGVPAIVEAIRSRKIECRVYRKDKFHAKAYITHARLEVVGPTALVGSSNFTFPGLSENIELNVQITGRQVRTLQEWYEEHWEEAEDVTTDILHVIERHIKEYMPFEVYAKALQEFFRGHVPTVTEWEKNESVIYQLLAPYQREAYHSLMKKASRYNGAFLCDGVGLGKTYVGLMLIERLIAHDRKNVALFVTKSARESVWEAKLKKHLPHLFGKYSQLEVFNHTDFSRSSDIWVEDFKIVADRADVVIIDEAHHFRNRGSRGEDGEGDSRYWKLYDLVGDKTMFMLTATPVNNRLTDLQHMIELFSRQQTDYFKEAPLGIHSLQGHFIKMEKALDKMLLGKHETDALFDIDEVDAEVVLRDDSLFRELVVQRSRNYVKKSEEQAGEWQITLFPEPKEPKVQEYSIKQTYGKLLSLVEEAFSKDKPLFDLSIYYPYAYYIGKDETIDPMKEGRQKQVVALIRLQFLKRFESSVEAFTMSCWSLMLKLMTWMEVHAETEHEKRIYQRWKTKNKKIIDYLAQHRAELTGEGSDEDAEEDVVTEGMMEAVDKLPRDEFKVDDIIDDTIMDLEQLAEFLKLLMDFKPSQDKKLTALKQLLKSDPVLKKNKVIIFTEFMDTARYLMNELGKEGIEGLEELDSACKTDRADVIRRFSPYYNDSSSGELTEDGEEEIRILISTDVLAEGLNLQDCTRLINYDLHWNPVRLMQRIGRIDRRMDKATEDRIVADHPEQKKLRGEVSYWNFLPPEDLDNLLRLYQIVSKKTLRISKTFGIEGKKLLKPDDDYEDLRDFYEVYEGDISTDEALHLEYQRLLLEYPDLEEKLNSLPLKVFSGKKHPSEGARAVFFCYSLPAPSALVTAAEGQDIEWTEEAGYTKWYLYDLDSEKILEEPAEIAELIRSEPNTPRYRSMEEKTLANIRAKLEKYITNTYLKKVQAPIGVKATLKAWMELS